MKTGLILEPPKRKDFSFERIFGAADRTQPIVPLGRDISGVPVVYQGVLPTCVSATVTWIREYLSSDKPDLAHEFLAAMSKTGSTGARPSQVLEPARKVGIVKQEAWDAQEKVTPSLEVEAAEFKVKYARLEDLSSHGLYAALKKNPIAIGVSDFRGIGPHFLAAFDVTADGMALKCANWHKQDEQDVVEIPFKDVVLAYAILPPDFAPPSQGYRVGLLGALRGVLAFRKAMIALFVLLTAGTGVAFGAGYSPITGYESTLTSRVDTDDTVIPVVTVKDRSGNDLSLANISSSSTVRVYFTLEPGNPSREEIIYCTGISGSSFTPCVRGIAFQGDSLASSSTLAKVHPPGSKVIISNVGVFFREFVSIDGTQRIDGAKYFSTIPRQSATTTLPTANDQYATKYYVDSVGAGGFTSANVSSSYGIQALGTSPEQAGILASSTPSTNGGFLNFATSTGRIYWDVVSFLARSWTWAGAQVFNSFSGAATALTLSFVPSSATDATNKSYVDLRVLNSSATGTTGMTISAGQLVYVSATGTIWPAAAGTTSTAYGFVGVASTGATTGTEITYTKTGGVATGLSGLTAGRQYFLSNTTGTVALTPGNISLFVGRAVSSTALLLTSPSSKMVVSGSISGFNGGETDAVTLGWKPTKVYAMCQGATGYLSEGSWALNSDGTSSTYSWGSDDDAAPYSMQQNSYICHWEETTTDFLADLQLNSGGFTVTSTGGAARTLFYRAEFEPELYR